MVRERLGANKRERGMICTPTEQRHTFNTRNTRRSATTSHTRPIILLIFLFLAFALIGCGPPPPPAATPTENDLTQTDLSEAIAPQEESTAAELAAESGSEIDQSVQNNEETATAPNSASAEIPNAPHPLIHQIQIGIRGNNNAERIELVNPTGTVVDLKNYTLIYQSEESGPIKELLKWRLSADLPANGYYLLVREGEATDRVPDATFDQSIIGRGMMTLLDPDDNIIDQVIFGDNQPAPKIGNNQALTRLDLGSDGLTRGAFSLVENPVWRNSGDSLLETNGDLTVALPVNIDPGETFQLVINWNGDSATTGEIVVPVPTRFSPGENAAGQTAEGNRLRVPLDGENQATVELTAPYTYDPAIFSGIYLEMESGERHYAEPTMVAVAAGPIPIKVARSLINQTVTIEGVATLPTEALFAGSTGTKFYIEDETGGIQVYVPGGKGVVAVNIGDRVRITGKTELYRTSLEVIPSDFATEIEILEPAAEVLEAAPTDAETFQSGPEYMGRLTAIEGTATRIEEETYSFEIDLTDESGKTVLVYIDKLTGITTEGLEVGQPYRVTGVGESFDGVQQLYPRQQTDIERLFPPILRLELDAPNNSTDKVIPLSLHIINDTPDTINDIFVSLPIPLGPIESIVVSNGIEATGDVINWQIDKIEGNGGRVTIPISVTMDITPESDSESYEQVVLFPAEAVAEAWPEGATSRNKRIFFGEAVPIWALQGSGAISPYVGENVVTEGVITGVFPELSGFFVQSAVPDRNIATSDGIFVTTVDGPDTPFDRFGFTPGDPVRLSGQVRELSDQTVFMLESLDTESVVIDPFTSDPISISPTELHPPSDPAESAAYFEAREGMLVAISETAQAVSPIGPYGEYAVVLADDQAAIGGDGRVTKDIDPTGSIIFVNDGSTVRHESGETLPYAVSTGDLLSNIVGPLAYSFGNYKIEPLNVPEISGGQADLPEIVPPAGYEEEASHLSIATFNVENLFDPFDPHPSNPPIPSLDEYERRLTKLADAVAKMDYPDIIALQEVENIGVLEDLVALPQMRITYQPVLLEGDDSRGIDNGYLVKEGVEIISVTQQPVPDGSLSRHPLILEVSIPLLDGMLELILINNHFSSMSGGEASTEPRRLSQASWVAGLAEEILNERPDANVVVLGDLNSFYESAPMDALRTVGLNHVYEFNEAQGDPRPYTYIFEGESETLDHILLSPDLFGDVIAVEALHINADFPLPQPTDSTARRISDHDPLVVTLKMEVPKAVISDPQSVGDVDPIQFGDEESESEFIEYVAFVLDLIKSNDRILLYEEVRFPITVCIGPEEKVRIETLAEMEAVGELIFHPAYLEELAAANIESADDLIVEDEQVGIANGAIWFNLEGQIMSIFNCGYE